MPYIVMKKDWNGKPYYSLDYYCKERFGEKVYKIALDGGFTCPNRDGTIGQGGCIFCSGGGSGEFATSVDPANPADSIHAQLEKGLSLFHDKKIGDKYIAYFQAYTNTYGEPQRLYTLYSAALSHPKVVGISIATRPDCLQDEVFAVLEQIRSEFPHKFLWIELGLQTIHEDTAAYIRRGYPLSVFETAVYKLKAHNIPFIIHMILGLPGEGKNYILDTLRYVNQIEPFGIKLQLLHILKNTDLALDYEKGLVPVYTKEEYLDILLSCIANLSPDIVVHRITGDGPKDLLIEPKWSLNKRDVLNSFHKLCRENAVFQGMNCDI